MPYRSILKVIKPNDAGICKFLYSFKHYKTIGLKKIDLTRYYAVLGKDYWVEWFRSLFSVIKSSVAAGPNFKHRLTNNRIMNRIQKLGLIVDESGYDAYVVTNSSNVLYYTGTIGGGRLVIAPGREPVLLSGGLNIAPALDLVRDCKVIPYSRENGNEVFANALLGCKTVAFDGINDRLKSTVEELENVDSQIAPDLVKDMRKIKDKKEINLMRRAGELADLGMQVIKDFLMEGVKEYEVAAEAAYAMRKNGAEALAFPFIVVSGPRAAYPHGGVTDRKLRKGDFVTIDMGAEYKHYKTDITRTFIMGEPTEKMKTIYETVLKANLAAFDMIKPGVPGNEIHNKAAKIIAEAGFGEFFNHGLGHGVGLDVHEGPSLSTRSKDLLMTGNVVTDEPGIYIRGYGGVRIEDTILVTENGAERLTLFPKDIDYIIV